MIPIFPAYSHPVSGKNFAECYPCEGATNWAVESQSLSCSRQTHPSSTPPWARAEICISGDPRAGPGRDPALLQPRSSPSKAVDALSGLLASSSINHAAGRLALSVSLWLFSVRDKTMWKGSTKAKGRVRRNKIPYLMHA